MKQCPQGVIRQRVMTDKITLRIHRAHIGAYFLWQPSM